MRYSTIILMVSSTGCQRIVWPCRSQRTRSALRSSLMWWEIVDREISKLLATLQTDGRISLFRHAFPRPRRICSKTHRRVSLDRALKAATTRSTSFADFPVLDLPDMTLPPHKIHLDVCIVVETYSIFRTFGQPFILKSSPKWWLHYGGIIGIMFSKERIHGRCCRYLLSLGPAVFESTFSQLLSLGRSASGVKASQKLYLSHLFYYKYLICIDVWVSLFVVECKRFIPILK